MTANAKNSWESENVAKEIRGILTINNNRNNKTAINTYSAYKFMRCWRLLGKHHFKASCHSVLVRHSTCLNPLFLLHSVTDAKKLKLNLIAGTVYVCNLIKHLGKWSQSSVVLRGTFLGLIGLPNVPLFWIRMRNVDLVIVSRRTISSVCRFHLNAHN